jgi:hypothetical protein
VGGTAFAYINVFKSHLNIGFFTGAFLQDPENLLEGSGKRMRHIKLRPDVETDHDVLKNLINNAYSDVKSRL